tara:strand:+ start:1389 stop:2213 length:825 start_codon:yes stop_codon:yes gene_type:complete
MIPVVFISKSIQGCQPSFYITDVMGVASKKNDNVFLLGDERNKNLCVGEYVPYDNYKSGYQEFESLYQSLSTIHPDIEKFCFSRWFILRDFMLENKITQALHLDTDILFFANGEEEAKRFKNLDCAISGRTSGHSSYWTIEGLVKFCDYILEIYKDKESFDFQRIAQIFTVRRAHNMDGGVCDMTLIEHFARYKAPHLVGELSILSNDLYYDHIIGTDEGFEFENGRKVFQYRDGIPYAKYLKTGELVPFATIHFQGSHNKNLIRQHHDLSIQH